jgi:hypothetical protein
MAAGKAKQDSFRDCFLVQLQPKPLWISLFSPDLTRFSSKGLLQWARTGRKWSALRIVESRGRHETARRLRATIGEVFRYAVATGRAETDPTGALRS